MRAAASLVLALGGSIVQGYTFAFYYVYAQGPVGGTSSGYKVFSTPPNCDELDNAVSLGSSSDVSSSRGVRCEGEGCSGAGGTGPIDILEVNFGSAHWTYYRERGDGHLVDTNNNGVGLCHQPEPNELSCSVGPIGHFNGFRILRCETDGEVPPLLGN